MNTRFLDVLNGRPVDRTPIWVMRQAGRYLPEYRAVRAKHSFLDMVYTPEVAVEVTLQPIDIFGFDAAIIFSDILVIPEALGMHVQFLEGRGPVFEAPIRDFRAIDRLGSISATDKLDPIYEAVRLARTELKGKVPLIGFAGAPWTLAAYMIEGSGSKTFQHARAALYTHPDAMHALLDRLTREIIIYLKNKIAAGAQAIQIFDSWAGQLTPQQFRTFSLPYLKKISEAISATGTPVILFARNAAHSLDELSQAGAAALGIDWQTEMAPCCDLIKNRVAVQGNLDPLALFATPGEVRAQVGQVLENVGSSQRHIFNLGHGILPQTPVASVRALVDAVHELSPLYHREKTGVTL